MERTHGVGTSLLEKLRHEVNENLTNDQFSVEMLAQNVGMSRSQLHRKLHAATGQSVSQFIREYRLQRGLELLKAGELTAAEVADRIGFGSATYFSKCFNEYYGFPPGEVKNRMAAATDGNETFQPVEKPWYRRILIPAAAAAAVLATVVWIYFRDPTVLAAVERRDKSVAILPFRNLSEDQRNVYFSEGVIDAVRTGLSEIGDLRVISRTSVERYRNSAKSAREIAAELGVASLLEGTIQRDNNKIRVEVRLVDGLTEEQVWARRYDRELQDVFAIQTEIAEQVAHELNAHLSAEEKWKLATSDTESAAAYDLYLKGVYAYRTYTNKGAHEAIALLHEAIALDSGYARAYAFLANSYFGLATIFGAELSAIEGLAMGKPFIDKALSLDPTLPEARMLLGFYRLYHDWDFAGAESEYKAAVTSGHPDAIAMYIDYLNFAERHDEAMVLSERLNALDPYYPNSRMTFSYIFNNRMKEALAFSEARLKTFNNYNALDSHGFLLLQLQRYDEAIVFFNKAIALEGIRYPRMLGWTGAAYARSGNEKQARQIIAELRQRLSRNEKGSIAFFIAVVFAALDDRTAAISWLQAAYKSHDMEMPWLMTEPQFKNLHNIPEFQKIAAGVGFKPATRQPR